MSSFSSRWRALAAAACEEPEPVAGLDRERMRAIARRGLAHRRDAGLEARADDGGSTAIFREWGSLALAAGLLLTVGLGLWWADLPLPDRAGTLARDLAELPRRVPRAPRLPSPAALLAELDDLASMAWNDPASPPGSTHPSAPETRP